MELSDLLTQSYSWILQLSHNQWTEISHILISSLSLEFGTQLENTGAVFPLLDDVQPGLTVSFVSPPLGDTALCLQIEGVVGLQSDPDQTLISASIFVFVDGIRIRAPEREWYEMELKSVSSGAQWHRLGWQRDLYGEFASVRTLGQLSRQSEVE